MGESRRPLTVLVTGAGRGIGRAVAERLAAAGDRVTGTVRDPLRAQRLTDEAAATGRTLRFLPLELTDPAQVAALAARFDAAGEGLDVLVHSAGYGVFGPVEEVAAEVAARQFTANVLAPLELTRRLLPALRARRGRVIWIGSLAGRFSLPFQAHYSATKSALAALSDALRIELRPHGVRVTCVEPGDVATGFTDSRTIVSGAGSIYREASERCLKEVERQERTAPGPEKLARAVERLCRTARPPARLPIGPGARTMCLLQRLLPDRIRELVVRQHYRQ